MLEQDASGERRVNRINYEISVLHSLREGLRCKAIWVAERIGFAIPMMICPPILTCSGQRIIRPSSSQKVRMTCIAGVHKAMEDALSRFNDGLPKNPSHAA